MLLHLASPFKYATLKSNDTSPQPTTLEVKLLRSNNLQGDNLVSIIAQICKNVPIFNTLIPLILHRRSNMLVCRCSKFIFNHFSVYVCAGHLYPTVDILFGVVQTQSNISSHTGSHLLFYSQKLLPFGYTST